MPDKYSKEWFDQKISWYYSHIPHGCDQCGFDTDELLDAFEEIKRLQGNIKESSICDDCDAIDNPSCSHCIGC